MAAKSKSMYLSAALRASKVGSPSHHSTIVEGGYPAAAIYSQLAQT